MSPIRITPTLFIVFFTILRFSVSAQSPSTGQSSVSHYKARVPTTNPTALDNNSNNAGVTIEYIDGLGRPLQSLGYRQSPALKDIVYKHQTYDDAGRPTLTYLPVPVSSSTGALFADPLPVGQGFYADQAPYSKPKAFDNSPLNRVTEKYGPGFLWHALAKYSSQSFGGNITANNVKLFRATGSGASSSSNYAAGTLYTQTQTDEAGSQSISFTDREGNLIEHWVLGGDGYQITRYIYDDLSRLAYVIQPEGSVISSFSNNDANFTNYIFANVYDGRSNIIEKHIPGGGWTYIVFDAADRPVMTQNAQQRSSNKWNFTQYDALGRIARQGEVVNTSSRSTLQTQFDNITTPYESYINGTEAYSSASFPFTLSFSDVRLVHYYDDYSWKPAEFALNTTEAFHLQWATPIGMPTGSWARNTENTANASGLHEALYYDNKGRLIQKIQAHAAGGDAPHIYPTITSYQYNFAGEVMQEKVKYNFSNSPTINTLTKNTYDHAGRLIKSQHSIDGAAASEVAYTYDEIGRMKKKEISQNSTTSGKTLTAKVLLHGPYDISTSGMMYDKLRASGLIPLTEPYSGLSAPNGKFQIASTGGESTTQAVLSVTGNDAIVDWVLVELRKSTDNAKIVKIRAALLQRDGDIVETDGVSPLNLGQLAASSYFVAIRHRNHHGVMTKEAVNFSEGNATLDFTTMNLTTQVYYLTTPIDFSGSGMLKLTDGKNVLWACDAGRDKKIKYFGPENDPALILHVVQHDPNNTDKRANYTFHSNVYEIEDANMDGTTRYKGVENDVSKAFATMYNWPTNTGKVYNYDFAIEQIPAGALEPEAPIPATGVLQTIDYSWHIRGGLRGINLDASLNPNPNATEKDLFAYKLEYESVGLWDGNIGRQLWKTSDGTTASAERRYDYTYDIAKRLAAAAYTGPNSENYGLPAITYDKNGNIKSLQRNGKSGSGYGLIDNLTYTYSGNVLSSVSDGQGGNNNTVDFVPRGNNSYSYHPDGSLKSDANEQISVIEYDTYLNQPKQIGLTDGRWIKYFYDGRGMLLKTSYSTGEYWENIGPLVRKTGTAYQLAMPEGRATYANNAWAKEFFYTDHLSNTRLAYKANGSQPQQTSATDFDPWGVRLNGIGNVNATQNRWEMQGHEKESTFGLNSINFGARTYNPTIARFDRVDRFAEMYQPLSTYQYSANNPINFVDINGDSLVLFKNGVYVSTVDNGKEEITGYNQQSTIGENGEEEFTGAQSFGFNDYADDMAGIKSGDLELRFVSNGEVSSMMSKSGVMDERNRSNAWSYIERESRPKGREGILSDGKSRGKMDYQNYTNEYPNYNSLNIVEGIAYNNADYGNFLWGQGGKQLGFSYRTLKAASHLNNAFNSGSDNPTIPYGVWDSPGDQRAIRNGYNYQIRKPKGLHR